MQAAVVASEKSRSEADVLLSQKSQAGGVMQFSFVGFRVCTVKELIPQPSSALG